MADRTCATCKYEKVAMSVQPCRQCVTVSGGDCWRAKEDMEMMQDGIENM